MKNGKRRAAELEQAPLPQQPKPRRTRAKSILEIKQPKPKQQIQPKSQSCCSSSPTPLGMSQKDREESHVWTQQEEQFLIRKASLYVRGHGVPGNRIKFYRDLATSVNLKFQQCPGYVLLNGEKVKAKFRRYLCQWNKQGPSVEAMDEEKKALFRVLFSDRHTTSSGPVTVPSSGPSSGPMGVRSGSMDLSVKSKMPIKKRMIREDTESDPKIAALQYMRQQMEMMYPGVWNRHHWNEYHAYSMALEDTAVYTGFLGLENYDTRRNYLLSMAAEKGWKPSL